MVQEGLKILLVSPLPPPVGGIATWSKRYLEWAQNNNLKVEIVNTAVIGKRINQINSERSLADEIRRTKHIIKVLKSTLEDFNPDIVHLNSPCGKFGIIRDYLCATVVKKQNTRLIIHYRCNIEDQIHDSKLQKFFLRNLAKKANLNLVLNTPSKKYLENESGKEGRLVANFIENSFILEELKIINATIENITFIGHVQKKKGIFEIIEVARAFPKIRFTLVGPVSSEFADLTVPNNLFFLGSVNKNQVRDILSKSDLFLFPTYTEGFANALLEAMAMGLPIITTPVGANEDMIEDSGGIIVSVKNHKETVDAITKLQNPEFRRKMSIWNVNKVKSNYSINRVMKEYVYIYNSVISKDNHE